MIDYEKELNASQREAVLYNDGPALVIAGAGSGKTRVLTYKLAHLIESGYNPQQLMALTFTNKAADEMKERVNQLVGSEVAREMMVGTFHSIFARILRKYAHLLGFNSYFTIYDTVDSKALIKKIIEEYQLDSKAYNPNLVLDIISDAKNHLISPKAYQEDTIRRRSDTFNGIPDLYQLYGIYADFCQRANAMDFDDLLFKFNVLLKDYPDVRKICQDNIAYLLIDEYQDTNASQYLIAKQLVGEKGNIFVVGDDAQSIYSFRGAQIDNILLFTKSFEGAKIFKLEQNYRSTKKIVGLANGLIRKNRQGIPKTLFTNRTDGNSIHINEYNSGREEATRITTDIFKQVNISPRKLSYSSFAILYRTNAQSRLFEELFRQYNIPYRIYGGMAFYSRSEIKNILAYLNILVNPYDDISFERILQYPRKGIGLKTIAILRFYATNHNISLYEAFLKVIKNPEELKNSTLKRLLVFNSQLGQFQKLDTSSTFYEIVDYILKESGIYEELLKDKSPEGIARLENTKEFLNSVADFENFYRTERMQVERDTSINNMEMVSAFVESVSLITSQETDAEGDVTNRVTLMTIHAAKGLEFDSIYITGMEEGIFPSIRSNNAFELEEERRLFYVAITRAKDNCTISLARTRMRNGSNDLMIPSRFLKELDNRFIQYHSGRLSWELESMPQYKVELDEESIVVPTFNNNSIRSKYPYKEGDRVKHPLFGTGVVISVEGDIADLRVIVRFDNGVEKIVLPRFSKLMLL